MGEVYRAPDRRLHGGVAIEVLPEAFARDATYMTRFEREAHVLASLNHPHIAAIYGLEDADHGLVRRCLQQPPTDSGQAAVLQLAAPALGGDASGAIPIRSGRRAGDARWLDRAFTSDPR